jgi:hypothetical protein
MRRAPNRIQHDARLITDIATQTGVSVHAPSTSLAAAKNDIEIRAIVYAAALMTRNAAIVAPQIRCDQYAHAPMIMAGTTNARSSAKTMLVWIPES